MTAYSIKPSAVLSGYRPTYTNSLTWLSPDLHFIQPFSNAVRSKLGRAIDAARPDLKAAMPPHQVAIPVTRLPKSTPRTLKHLKQVSTHDAKIVFAEYSRRMAYTERPDQQLRDYYHPY